MLPGNEWPLWSGIKDLATEWWFMSLTCYMGEMCECEVATVRGSLMKCREDSLSKSYCIISCHVCTHVLTCTLLQFPIMLFSSVVPAHYWRLISNYWSSLQLLTWMHSCAASSLKLLANSMLFLQKQMSVKGAGDQEWNCRIVLIGRDL